MPVLPKSPGFDGRLIIQIQIYVPQNTTCWNITLVILLCSLVSGFTTNNDSSSCREHTCDGAGGRASVQDHVRMRRDVAVENRHLLGFGNPVLDGINLAGGSRPGLLGRG